MNETPKLSLREKLGFGSFSMASNIVYQFKSLYYLFFLTNVLKISVLAAGTILALGTVWDAVNDPLVGYYAVNHRFKNGESVRPFALWYAVPWAVTTVLLFTNFHASPAGTILLAYVVYFFFELLNTCVAIPYNSMGSLATNRDADRRSINVHRNLGGCLGTAIGAVACMPLLKLFGALDQKGNLIDAHASRGFLLAACVMGVICVLGCFAHYFTTRERVMPAGKEEHIGFFRTFRVLYTYKTFVMNTLYILLYGVINLLLLTNITYYSTYALGSTAKAMTFEVVYLVAAVITSFLVSPIDRLLGRKKTMLLGGAFYVLSKVWFVLQPSSVGAMMVNCLATGVAVTITFVMFNTNRNNLADLVEWREGRRLDGMIGTADNLAAKLGDAAATELLAVALHLAGYDGNLSAQPESAVKAIEAMLGWVPMVVGALLIVVVWFLDIDRDMDKMRADKAAKAEGGE